MTTGNQALRQERCVGKAAIVIALVFVVKKGFNEIVSDSHVH